MNADNDNKLKDLFSGLRRQDAARVPEFNRIVQAATRAREVEPGFAFSWLRLAAGAAALVAAIFLLTTFQNTRPRLQWMWSNGPRSPSGALRQTVC